MMGLLTVQQPGFDDAFNVQPLGLEHGLHRHPLFTPERIRRLVECWPDKDFFVAAGAAEAGTQFYSTPDVALTPADALARLEQGSYRILLKRLERHDMEFRDLLAELVAEVATLRPQLHREKILRLESFLFISSASTITPFHFDPEIGLFFQIAGNKTYHMYSPSVLSEEELEKYYLRGSISIGQVDFNARKACSEFRFDLRPGLGMHQPANAPHWVQTRGEISISYSFAIETRRTRAMGRTRAFNGLCRHMAMTPARPGLRPLADSMKANCIQVMRPVLDRAVALRRLMT